jgi:hypoxanthine phosphoribosyltransferase
MQNVVVKERVFSPFIRYEAIKLRLAEMAESINNDYAAKTPVFLAVLNGSFFFAADLLKVIKVPCRISFIKLSSYNGMSSNGAARTIIGLDEDLSGQDVIILEDIVDSGVTMVGLVQKLSEKNLASLRIATLLHKPAAAKEFVKLDYVGFEIDNKFVLGYGLDYDGFGRNYKDIYQLAE